MRFGFIEGHSKRWPLATMCRVLGVTRSGYYAWRGRPASPRQAAREALVEKVREVHAACRGVYGSPRLTVELNARGVTGCENTVARAMRLAGVAGATAKRFVPRTTDSTHAHPVAANVLGRQFDAGSSDAKWVADITYVPTDQGWLYVAAVLDLFSRRVVGWAMAEHMRAELVTDALDMALAARSPRPGLVHHSDRGSQYAGSAHRDLLAAHGVTCSMSRAGNCYDNAVMESFWATLKRELVDGRKYATRDQARRSIFEYVEVFYNRIRRHSSLDYVSPEQFEATAG